MINAKSGTMLYYIHGYESNCETVKAMLAKSLGAKCIHYENDDIESGRIFKLISKIKNDDVVIGSSLGGFLALYSTASTKILLNPLINPEKMNELGDYSVFVDTAKKKNMNYSRYTIYTFLGKNDKILKHDIPFFYNISKELFVLDDDHRFSKKRDFVFYMIEKISGNLE